MSDKQNAFMQSPIDYLCNQKKPTIAQVAYVFATLRQHGRDGGTYRYLIYDLLGFDESAYTPLYFAGGMELSNLFCTRDEFDVLQKCVARALEVIRASPDNIMPIPGGVSYEQLQAEANEGRLDDVERILEGENDG